MSSHLKMYYPQFSFVMLPFYKIDNYNDKRQINDNIS